jgi:hypothetical protein
VIRFQLQSGRKLTIDIDRREADNADIALAALIQLVTPRLAGPFRPVASTLSLGQSSRSKRLTIPFRLQPVSLHHALWLQLWLALSGQTERQCEWCRNWFAVGVNVTGRRPRSDRIFCRDACKVAARRARLRGEKRPRAQQSRAGRSRREAE